MKTIIALCMVFVLAGANDSQLAVKIYHSIAQECTGKEHPKIYLHGDFEEFSGDGEVQIVDDCKAADFILTSTSKPLPMECVNMLVFANNYKIFKKSQQIIGAFFWQKGRPNIIFDADRLRTRHMTLDSSYSKYIE